MGRTRTSTVKPIPELLESFFFYPLGEEILLGSENPWLYPNAAALAAALVARFGIRATVSLADDSGDFEITGVTQYHCPLPHDRAPTLAEVHRVVGLVCPHLQKRHPVWCYRHRGLDRTGCVLGSILARRGVPAAEVIRQVTSHFPPGRRSPRLMALS